MNKKGFTLVELLAVIVILGLLIAIISPVVKNLINDSENNLSEQQKKLVVEATKKYMIENSELLPEGSDRAIVYMSDLIDKGVIDNDKIIDPKSKGEINGCVVVSYNNEFNQYDYNYSENENDCLITVTFDPEGGNVDTTSKQVKLNSTYGELPTPTREGYTFKGWRGKNMFVPPINQSIKSRNVDISVNNGEYSIDGIPTETQYIDKAHDLYDFAVEANYSNYLPYSTVVKKELIAGNYSFSIKKISGNVPSNNLDISIYKYDENVSGRTRISSIALNENENNNDFSLLENIQVYFVLHFKDHNQFFEGIHFYVQLEKGDTATEFEPYQEYSSDTVVTKSSNHTLHAIWEIAS